MPTPLKKINKSTAKLLRIFANSEAVFLAADDESFIIDDGDDDKFLVIKEADKLEKAQAKGKGVLKKIQKSDL